MFSGKTEELIRRMRRAQIANQKVAIFKPVLDNRYSDDAVVSHNQNAIPSIGVENSGNILVGAQEVEVVGVDEAQFFDMALPDVCQELATQGIRVICAGLDMDYKGNPFGPMPNLMAVSEYITKVHAICPHCGSLATHSYRLTQESGQVLIGEKEKYEPRCRMCYQMGNILELR